MVRIKPHFLSFFILVQLLPVNDVDCNPFSYQYQETRNLVRYVEQAARKLAREGPTGFSDDQQGMGIWGHDGTSLFILDMTGILVFHSEEPEMVGINLSDYIDPEGKPFFRHMLEVVSESEVGTGWVHYRGYRHDQVFPEWMASYVMKVQCQSGEAYVIGSGLSSPRLERKFIEDLVDSAARQVETKGVSALSDLNEKSGRFVFSDVMMMVLKMDGTLLVDPSVPLRDQDKQWTKRNLMDFRDSIGNYVFREVITRLKTSDSTWILYLCPKSGEIKPSKKALYMRKVEAGGIAYLIGSSYFLARPVWMK